MDLRLCAVSASVSLALAAASCVAPPAHAAATPCAGQEILDRVYVGRPDDGATGSVDITLGQQHFALTEADLGIVDPSGRFGAVVQPAILDEDQCEDLIVAAPGSGSDSRGSVYILMGGDDGPGAGAVYRLRAPEGAGDSWGTTVRYDSGLLAVGAPRTPLSPAAGGAVWLYPIAEDMEVVELEPGQPGTPIVITQDSKGVPGVSEAGDEFGASIAIRIDLMVIGAPGEAVGTRAAAGAVTVLGVELDPNTTRIVRFGATTYTQNSPGFATAAESGDRFGASVATGNLGYVVAAGAPGESLGEASRTGMVHVFTQRTSDGLHYRLSTVRDFSQDSAHVAGVNEDGDRWGSALAIGNGCDDFGDVALVVGAPNEDVGTAVDAGSLTRFTLPKDSWPDCRLRVVEGAAPVGAAAEAGDQFGAAVSGYESWDGAEWTWHFLVGAPGKDVDAVADAGVVFDFAADSTTAVQRTQVGGPVAGAHFGVAIG